MGVATIHPVDQHERDGKAASARRVRVRVLRVLKPTRYEGTVSREEIACALCASARRLPCGGGSHLKPQEIVMSRNRRAIFAIVALVGIAACGGNQGERQQDQRDRARESTTASPTGDAPPAAITDPAAPPPIGTDVGAVGTDATAAPPTPGDTANLGAHP
ncbi:hypothetical protein BH20GEM3_BH20GEM3_14800 [soil metagenome]